MLIKNTILDRIKSGEISLIFRRWKRAGVKSGGTQMTQRGILSIISVAVVTEEGIGDLDAIAAGFPSRAMLLADLYDRNEDIYRVEVAWAGEDPRKELREDDDLSESELADIIAKLQKLDSTSKRGPWTQSYLQIIDDQPNIHAAILAAQFGLEIPTFKPWIRKLKALGLTESLRPGYKLSPRGNKVLAELVRVHS